MNRRIFLSTFALLFSVSTSSPATEIRNVLFLVSDDLKASVLGCYGDPVCKTPNIDALAKSGMLFERAYCQGTVCRPSRTSFMRSRYRDKGNLTLGEHLQKHDFYSARVGKIFHMRVPGDIIPGTNGEDVPECWTERFNMTGREAHTPGEYACLNLNIFTDELEGRQSTRMPHRMFVTVQYDGDGSDQPDHKAATKAIELLKQRAEKPGERFFLAVGFVRPHYPMVAPRPYFEAYPLGKIELPENPSGELDDIPAAGLSGGRSDKNGIGKWPENQRKMWQGYYATVDFMDEQVGRIVAELDRLGLRESTAIVFTSDHGYHLGEHTMWQKGNLHEEVVRVPLIVSAPGLEGGQRSKTIVELVDIYPTLCDLAGVPIPAEAEGKSLVSVLKNPKATVKFGARSFAGAGIGLRTPRWAYMRYKKGEEELYDMDADPKQFKNLAEDPKQNEVLEKLRAEVG
ncbi:MAG: sulfatase, partial [Verrucomicrobiales bacterium]|nr:sulfatase [Verrucomicrobiales bacterium]